MDFRNYLGKAVVCGCGREHRCDIEGIYVERGALKRLPELLEGKRFGKICVVMDIHTREAAGNAVCDILRDMGTDFGTVLFEEEELVPDERVIGELFIGLDRECDFLIAVGSGVINDLCKLVAYRMDLDYMVVATAPSMDGYASNVAPVIIKNTKTTYEARLPKYILADVDILRQAPWDMITAGVGDILGKYVCLMDWKLASLVKGEYFCEYTQSLVRASINKVMESLEELEKRTPESIASVMEGLILSGICMSYIGNSRPASGSEHHMSHFWEMTALENGTPDAFHGTKVAVGTVISLKMYEILGKLNWETFHAHPTFQPEAWAGEINEAYGKAAPTVAALEEKLKKNGDEAVKARRASLLAGKEEICREISALPSADSIVEALKKIKAPYKPQQIHVSEDTLRKGIYYAKDLRDRFGLLQVLYDNDLQESMAEAVIDYIHDR